MQTFIDTVTQVPWVFDPDVIVTNTAGLYSFTSAHGMPLQAPTTLQPYTPSAAVLLAQAQAAQVAVLAAAYSAATQATVSYTSKAGVTKTYQADQQSVYNLQASLSGAAAAQATPAGFYWVSLDNTQVPFTYADLQGLAQVIWLQAQAAFQRLQVAKAAVAAATTPAAVAAVVF